MNHQVFRGSRFEQIPELSRNRVRLEYYFSSISRCCEYVYIFLPGDTLTPHTGIRCPLSHMCAFLALAVRGLVVDESADKRSSIMSSDFAQNGLSCGQQHI